MIMDPTPIWYGHHPLSRLLLPLSWIYCAIMRARRLGYRGGWLRSHRLAVPVIIVGNLSVGGTGKTPLVLHLVALLKSLGWTPGILARGYGGRAEAWPQRVRPDSDPDLVGDEPVLLARRGGCLVVAGPDRVAAGEMAIEQGGCDILVSDDGLQHYRLARDLEIVLIDGARGFGNGHCLPAGPLREPPTRLKGVELILYKDGNGQGPSMRLQSGAVVSLARPESRRELADFRARPVRAVAGIGHPEGFFALLERAGLEIERLPFPDHHRYTEADLARWRGRPVIMTEKDAVKCATFGGEDLWYLPVEAVLDRDFEARLFSKLRGFAHG